MSYVGYFDAREYYPVIGWGPNALLIRIINGVSVKTDRSEAMLPFDTKKSISVL